MARRELPLIRTSRCAHCLAPCVASSVGCLPFLGVLFGRSVNDFSWNGQERLPIRRRLILKFLPVWSGNNRESNESRSELAIYMGITSGMICDKAARLVA
jgi:hypothetical protein